MTTTVNRITAGIYHVYEKDGYLLATIRKANKRTRLWFITYGGGTPGGATPTLKAAIQLINDRWTNDQ